MPTAEQIQTAFGSVNAVIDQTTNSILKIEAANKALSGQSPSPQYGMFGSSLSLPRYTTSQWVGIGLVVLVGAAMAFILYREFK